MKQESLDCLADISARNAHQNMFPSRWGVLEVDEEFIAFFNNNPPKAGRHVRESQRVELIRRLAEKGIEAVAYGEWPQSGPDEGYSYAQLFRATPEQADLILGVHDDIFIRFGWDAKDESAGDDEKNNQDGE